MKIRTTEAVRRFNAQVELVDLALDFAASQLSDPGALVRLLELAGHRDLGKTFAESMRQVCITGSGWPDARPGREPGQPPDNAAASSPTKSAVSPHEDWCMCHSCCEAAVDEADVAEMRTTLKQCRSVIGCLAWFGESPATLKSLKTTARIALDRINSIIPPSEA